jgi:Raf kinase inhibitor-like YbhB/YbcL family protein
VKLTSAAFAEQGEIPASHTCEGGDRAPALAWTGAPAGTKSFALVVDDPDAPDPRAPKMTRVHWVLYNIPGSTEALPEGGETPDGARDGLNDWKRAGWNGPCPPVGRHRYFFKLYAVDVVLPNLKTPTKSALEAAIQGHILATAELVGTYLKKTTR